MGPVGVRRRGPITESGTGCDRPLLQVHSVFGHLAGMTSAFGNAQNLTALSQNLHRPSRFHSSRAAVNVTNTACRLDDQDRHPWV